MVIPDGKRLEQPRRFAREIHIPIVTFDQPMGGSLVTIWGVPLTIIGQSSQFNPSNGQ
jgi:hypothetical protein